MRSIRLGLVLVICISYKAKALPYIGFGDVLFKEGKYDRAVVEYERINLFSPSPEVQEKIGMCYWKMGNLERAATVVKELEDMRKLVQLYVEMGEYSLARFVVEEQDKNLEGWIYLIEGKWEDAAGSFESEDLKKVALRGKLLPYKSDRKALLLSIVVPGLGEVYARNFLGGAITFGLNGISMGYGIKCFRDQDYITGGLVTSFFFYRFYLGGLQSAVRSVRDYNKRVKERYIKEMSSKYRCPFELNKLQ